MRQPPENSATARVLVAGREAEAVQQFASACPRRIAADRVQAIVQHGLARGVVGGFGHAQFGFERAEFGVAIEHMVEGGALGRFGLLAHVSDDPVARTVELAAIGAKFAADQREQAALAAAIAARQADTPARMNEKIRSVQQKSGTTTQVQVVKAQHGAKFTVRGSGVCQRHAPRSQYAAAYTLGSGHATTPSGNQTGIPFEFSGANMTRFVQKTLVAALAASFSDR